VFAAKYQSRDWIGGEGNSDGGKGGKGWCGCVLGEPWPNEAAGSSDVVGGTKSRDAVGACSPAS
jgi:hypothetical protein